MSDQRNDQGGERPRGAEYMERMREGGYGSDRDPATAADGAMAGRGSGQSAERVAHTGVHDLTHGASEGPDDSPAESGAERARREEAEQIGE